MKHEVVVFTLIQNIFLDIALDLVSYLFIVYLVAQTIALMIG
jgi:hypothetical protein